MQVDPAALWQSRPGEMPEPNLWPDNGGFVSWDDCYSYIKGLLGKLQIPVQEIDDVASNIVVYLLRRDVFAMYDPSHISQHTSKPVTFRAFLSHQVALYERGQYDKLTRLADREALIMDREASDSGTSWAELFAPQWFDDYSQLDAAEFIARMRVYLAMVPPRREEDRRDLLALFDELVAQAQATGEVSMAEVAEHFGVAASTARSWVRHLREVLAAAPAAAPQARFWTVGGVRVGVPEVLSAIAVLEAAKGIMVAQPLQRAGHPLAQAAKGWYHPFAKEEARAYPECAVDPQTHTKPAGHVKLAVLHRLRRYLAEALPEVPAAAVPVPVAAGAVPAPEAAPALPSEPDTPQELIEAQLWQLRASPGQVSYVMNLVSQIEAASERELACA